MDQKVALLLMGLVLGTATALLVTTRVRAQVPAPTFTGVRWEQDCEQTHGVDEARTIARARGDAGWELVALDAGVLCFKRPILAAPKSPDPWPGY